MFTISQQRIFVLNMNKSQDKINNVYDSIHDYVQVVVENNEYGIDDRDSLKFVPVTDISIKPVYGNTKEAFELSSKEQAWFILAAFHCAIQDFSLGSTCYKITSILRYV